MEKNEISKLIFLTSTSSSDVLKDEIVDQDLHTYITYEFIFLYLHLISREQFAKDKNYKFVDGIASDIINASIHSMYKNSSSDKKEIRRLGMLRNLNEAEQTYGACTKLIDTEVPFSDSAVFSVFGKRILNILNRNNEAILMTKIMGISMTGWSSIKNNYV